MLTWADVEGESTIHVTKAWDYAEEKIKPPKKRNGVRRVPIPPTLAPLLARMRKGRDTSDLVVPHLSAFGEDHLARMWRRHLIVAGITRSELHASTRTHVQSNFRSCRDSGLTWLALMGVDVAKIMRRAGHDTIQTTMGYVKLAEDLSGELGAPFGPLAPSLVSPKRPAKFRPSSLGHFKNIANLVGAEGFDPPLAKRATYTCKCLVSRGVALVAALHRAPLHDTAKHRTGNEQETEQVASGPMSGQGDSELRDVDYIRRAAVAQADSPRLPRRGRDPAQRSP